MNNITLQSFVDEAKECGLTASIEHPGCVHVNDAVGRLLVIGDVNGPWGVDVYASDDAAQQGVPADGDDLQGDDARTMFAHALVIANRVATVK